MLGIFHTQDYSFKSLTFAIILWYSLTCFYEVAAVNILLSCFTFHFFGDFFWWQWEAPLSSFAFKWQYAHTLEQRLTARLRQKMDISILPIPGWKKCIALEKSLRPYLEGLGTRAWYVSKAMIIALYLQSYITAVWFCFCFYWHSNLMIVSWQFWSPTSVYISNKVLGL